MKKQPIFILFFVFIALLLTSCGFHLQGPTPLTPVMHRMYLETDDPYGTLSRTLGESLKMSHVQLVSSPSQANVILEILHDDTAQVFLSVSGTNQVRQYNLIVTVVFQLTDTAGRIIIPPQTLSETRPITVQSSQILGSSNETTLFYQQMRRTLAHLIMSRLASKETTAAVLDAFHAPRKITSQPYKTKTP